MEENNNQQQGQYQQYQAPQGGQQGQMFQGFKAPNTEEGLKKKFADLKTIFLILGILAVIGVIIDLVTVVPAIQILSNPYARLLGVSGMIPVLIILVIVDIAFCAIQWVGMVLAKKEDKRALILGIIAGGIELLIVVVCLCTGSGFKWFNAIMGGALIADCILTLNSYKAVRGNK